jgi:branched-chain amino acid transport system substrate-binding protein
VRPPRALVCVAAALALAGCGSAVRPTAQRIRGSQLNVYFAGPFRGASSLEAAAALDGARLALDRHRRRIGRYRIELRVLDDSTVASQGWDPAQTSANARQVAGDPDAIGYVGDFNSGASAVSIPVLNRAGIPQVSPGSTAVGLTSAGIGAAPGEPDKYYPTGIRTFARVVPTDAYQAVALVDVERSRACRSTFVLYDDEVDGYDTAVTFVLTAKSAGLRVAGILPFKRGAAGYAALATSVAGSGADCVVVSAIDEHSAALLTEQLAGALPHDTFIAANGLADSAYTDPADGGVPVDLDPRVYVVSATLALRDYPASARRFAAAFTRRFGALQPPAIFGYEAMEVLLDAIGRATGGGRRQADRAAVRAALLDTRQRRSVLGPFRIGPDGDTSIHVFGIYRLLDGKLSFLGAAG